jgi:arabinogalactan endo-1,4-beta-galactosidase
MNYKKLFTTVLLAIALQSPAQEQRYVGGDISLLPTYEENGANYMDKDGKKIADLLSFLKEQGMNAMRVRLFVDPSRAPAAHKGQGVRQDLDYVKKLGKKIKDAGLKLMLDFHYSDTWADPSKQATPYQFTIVKKQAKEYIYDYTKDCLEQLKAAGATPDFIQTGNEISWGMMYDSGCKLEAKSDWSGYKDTNWDNFSTALINAGKACREVCPEAKIIIHTEQAANTPLVTDYYKRLQQYGIDYDIIGTSYYPYYHGTLAQLNKTLTAFEQEFPDKKIMVVETGCGYHWKMGDNDTGYPLTYEGQRQFTADLITTLKAHQNVNGLFWWFLEANEYGLDWNTKRVTDGWYNASLFDNETGRALPALYELKNFSGGGAGLSQISIDSRSSDSWYTIDGIRHLSSPSKSGLYIHNGQKIAVR